MRIYTVGELKKVLANVADDVKIVSYQENMETCGYQHGASINLDKRSPIEKQTYDRFDHTDYTYEVYEKDNENGEAVVSIG